MQYTKKNSVQKAKRVYNEDEAEKKQQTRIETHNSQIDREREKEKGGWARRAISKKRVIKG